LRHFAASGYEADRVLVRFWLDGCYWRPDSSYDKHSTERKKKDSLFKFVKATMLAPIVVRVPKDSGISPATTELICAIKNTFGRFDMSLR
jgi:hypothetical protein